MHITLEKTEVFNMLDTPMLKLDALRKVMENQVVELVSNYKPSPWWDLLGRIRGTDRTAILFAEMGTSSVQQVESLYEHLAAMRSLAELSNGPVRDSQRPDARSWGTQAVLCSGCCQARTGYVIWRQSCRQCVRRM